DESVRRIKGPSRPFMKQEDRAAVLKALESVDDVVIFDDLTPENLIREIKPDVLVKGGDWTTDQIVGADFVVANGGEVHSLPLVDGYSSTGYLEKIVPTKRSESSNGEDRIERSLTQHAGVFQNIHDNFRSEIAACAELIIETVANGKKVLVCGNGGSAADAQHIAAEFVGRYEAERRGLPAIALTTDTSALTALSNDYGFERVFARQVEALGVEGDLLIAISTSGDSPNVIAATMAARSAGCKVLAMTGQKGTKLASLSDMCIKVPSTRTARIQEAHITIAHIWCELLDEYLMRSSN
ncbi:MAG TPA: D-sedoheptulose 7-phosphate isomerase, partial [Pyrinomonadaceae bacterium]|nr:D-sedoheptulose 7-phosphate isomerase [Pyrinomonadaceae bacterium]